MKKLFILLSAALLVQTGEALAGPKNLKVDPSNLPTGLSAERINRKLQELQRAAFRNSGLNKSTATERVATISNYDFTRPSGSQLVDTIRLKYLAGRGSAFNFSMLDYDFYNHADHPNPFIFASNNLYYDTALNAKTGAIIERRAYNAAGKVTRDQTDTSLFQYTYDASNRTTSIVHYTFNSGTGNYETTYRDLYYYNTAGYLVLDSLEDWNAGTGSWTRREKLKYTYDASGRVVLLNVDYDLSGTSVYNIARQHVTYAGASTAPSSIVTELTTGPGGLDSYFKEDFSYAAGALTSHDQYQWISGAWSMYIQERRHLNANSLPDSVFYRYWNAGKAIDSTYAKLGYNGQNNPLYRLDFDRTSPIPWGASSWTYEAIGSTGVTRVNVARLEFYPNPATEKIQLKGLTQGNYLIYNTAGQLMQSGQVQNGGSIPVQLLSPGMYTLNVKDASGQPYSATFIRQ